MGRQTAAGMIRTARERREWSQAELARRSGMTRAAVSLYESAARQPSAATLARILDAAGMSLTAVPGSAEESARQDAQLQDVLELAEHLPRTAGRSPLAYPSLLGCR